jgi:hypothetical protein
MNGPIPEDEAKINRIAKAMSTTSMGINHHNFLFQRNPNSSPTTEKFDIMLRKKVFI